MQYRDFILQITNRVAKRGLISFLPIRIALVTEHAMPK